MRGTAISTINPRVIIAGGGLAGTEAAWQLAERGIGVVLYEMRPVRTTDAHQTDRFAELTRTAAGRCCCEHRGQRPSAAGE